VKSLWTGPSRHDDIPAKFTKNVPMLLHRVDQVQGSQPASTSVREQVSIDYQCATKPHSAWIQSLVFRCVWWEHIGRIYVKIVKPLCAGSMWAGFGPQAGLCWPWHRPICILPLVV